MKLIPRAAILLLVLIPALWVCHAPASGQNKPASAMNQPASGQSVVVDTIVLEGNKITRPRIILREMHFASGDTLDRATLATRVAQAEENIFNTGLFNLVTIDTVPSSHNHIQVIVQVIERWYFWPIPYISFPDKNLNAWLETFDLSTLTWGLDVKFFNAWGRNETLTLLLHFGFNQAYGFTYEIPYLNKQQTWGLGFGADITLNKSVITQTIGNKNEYLRADSGLLQQHVHGAVETYYRPSLFWYHTFGLHFDYYKFTDTLIQTPGYVTDSAADQSFFSLYYKLKLDHRDVRYYPLKGYYFDLVAINHGFPGGAIHLFSLQSNFRKYWHLGGRWYWGSGITGKWSWPEEQPFFLQRGIGYGRDFIRGFEYYSIQGPWFGLMRNNLKFALIKPAVGEIPFIRSKQFRVIPYGLFLNLFVDAGYVGNQDALVRQNNPLVNEFLVGYGIGIDFITYYDIVVDLNFAMNSLGEPGIYLHFIAPI
jgi:outer membrane protein assembly factor BamA